MSSPIDGNLGRRGEEVAWRYLAGQGYRLVERNLRTRWGEIDLIVWHGSTLVFVEVKTRRTQRAGSGAEAVSARKQAQLRRLAQSYLGRYRQEPPCRFDVVAVGPGDVLEHLIDAF